MNGQFGAAFCRGVEPFLANLKALIDEADRLGVGTWPPAVTAKAVHEDIDGFVIYSPWGSTDPDGDCIRHTREVQAAIAGISALLRTIPGASLSIPRPDAELPSPTDVFPLWVKIAGFSVLGVMALGYMAPLIAFVASRPRKKMAGYRRRSRR